MADRHTTVFVLADSFLMACFRAAYPYWEMRPDREPFVWVPKNSLSPVDTGPVMVHVNGRQQQCFAGR